MIGHAYGEVVRVGGEACVGETRKEKEKLDRVRMIGIHRKEMRPAITTKYVMGRENLCIQWGIGWMRLWPCSEEKKKIRKKGKSGERKEEGKRERRGGGGGTWQVSGGMGKGEWE